MSIPVAEQKTWIIDFDETLARGSITWALEQEFPKFIAAHQLPVDGARLNALVLELQEVASQHASAAPLVARLFNEMGWREDLQDEFLKSLFGSYTPTIFDDTLPFLDRLRERSDRILIVSNNPRTLEQVPILALQDYFLGVYTPSNCPGTLPKPDRSLWEYVRGNHTEIDPQHTIVVGDDPWSEGAFAEACGLECWIVDRLNRFEGVSAGKRYGRVRSLLEIPLL
jgi:FMN phosphatase YigB (HAD superfamily)